MNYVKCRSCGTAYGKSESQTCPNCGSGERVDAVKCPYCGQIYVPDIEYKDIYGAEKHRIMECPNCRRQNIPLIMKRFLKVAAVIAAILLLAIIAFVGCNTIGV